MGTCVTGSLLSWPSSSEEPEAQGGSVSPSRSHGRSRAPAGPESRPSCPLFLAQARRLRGLTRIVSTRLCTLAGSSTDGSGRMSTLIGTLCTAAMQPEWMLPPCAPPGSRPSGASVPVPILRSAPPARSPIPPSWPPAPPARRTQQDCTIVRPRGTTAPGPSGSARKCAYPPPRRPRGGPVSHVDPAAECLLRRPATPSRCPQWTRPAADSG